MKRAAICLLLMAAGLLWTAGGRAQDANAAAAAAATATSAETATETIPAAAAAALPDVPYATIIARNMFGLVPIPKEDPHANDPPVEPPPKITPTGIMTIFNKDQAIFKVANKPKPGQQPKDDSFVLAEGDMQDEITVVKINHVDGIITFNNHGTIQDLPLVPAKDSGPGPGPGAGPGAGNRGAALARMNAMNPQLGGGGMGAFPAKNAIPGSGIGNATPQMGMGGGTAGAVGSDGLTHMGGTTFNANRVFQPVDDPNTSPEEAAILIEAQRLKYMQSGDQRHAIVLPPTPLTQQNIQGFQNSSGGQ